MIAINLVTRKKCNSCKKYAVAGRSLCLYHQKEYGKRNKEKYLEKKRNGLCVMCGVATGNGKVLCAKHLVENRERCERYRDTPAGTWVNKEVGRVERARRREEGVCIGCGKNRTEKDYVKCESCMLKDVTNSIKLRETRITTGLCTRCGEKLIIENENNVNVFSLRKRTRCDRCRQFMSGVDKSLESRFSRTRSSRQNKGRKWTLTFEDYAEIVTQPCYYCGLLNDTDQAGGLDRVDNDSELEYDKTNVVSCCPICNMVRNAIFTVEEMKMLGVIVQLIKLRRLENKVISIEDAEKLASLVVGF